MPLFTVHPRAGGEHTGGGGPPLPPVGSSPRGRGTQRYGYRRRSTYRFIPARAGNTSSRCTLTCRRTVHPRAGGEHGGYGFWIGRTDGSSPRGRGTHLVVGAGSCPVPVHPRAGGEHFAERERSFELNGSSPRGRGTQGSGESISRADRFIPARAVNTRRSSIARCRASVHPRAGGEHKSPASKTVEPPGSSPRGRGTLPGRRPSDLRQRFIPARAGNTAAALTGLGGTSVHPRAGGEHGRDARAVLSTDGSSPRGRGTPAMFQMANLYALTVHPRAGGEH